MAEDFDTQSELDFFEFCRRQQWKAEKIARAEQSGVRTPDFRVTTRTQYEFIAEVTEFEPLPPLAFGEVRSRGGTLGNPIRDKLAEKKGQFKLFAKKLPTLIVISAGFDHFTELESTSFDAALYGELRATVHVPSDPTIPPRFEDKLHSGGRRFFGKSHNTSVSAVAALDGRPQMLRIYHNKYAAVALEPSRLSVNTEYVEHYGKSTEGTPGWQRQC